MEVILELERVTKKYGGKVAVDNVTFQVVKGEFLTLLGPSGCGKTTILRLIAGFERPTAGKVYIHGQDATEIPPYRRRVNTVFQHYALFPHMDVFSNVAFGLERRGLRRSEIDEKARQTLELVKLAGHERHYPNQLSGGERQRVALARAIILQPDVLLLDEPLSALDRKLRKEMQVELKHLQKQLHMSFVFVTHDQEEALVMSDRVAVMNTGRIEQISESSQMYNRPATEFVADFMGVRNLLTARISEVNGTLVSARTGTGLTIFSENERTTEFTPDERVTVAVRPEKIFVGEVRPEPSSRNLFPGTVIEKVYTGASTAWQVGLSSGDRITASEQNRQESKIDIGSEVFVWWDERDTLILKG
jgi:spermidine/putrescine transport system ATP-binding protein